MSGKRIVLESMARGVKGTQSGRVYNNSAGKIAGNVLDDALRGRKHVGLNVKTVRKNEPSYGFGAPRGRRLAESEPIAIGKRDLDAPVRQLTASEKANGFTPDMIRTGRQERNGKRVLTGLSVVGGGTAGVAAHRLMAVAKAAPPMVIPKIPSSGMAALQTAGANAAITPAAPVPLAMKKPNKLTTSTSAAGVSKAVRQFDPETARQRHQGQRTGVLAGAGGALTATAVRKPVWEGRTRGTLVLRNPVTSKRKLAGGAAALALANVSRKRGNSAKNEAWT